MRFEGVWKLFGDVPAVRDLNLTVEDGEFLVLVGPSGCGKTTSLRILGGLETPSYGRIWMGERDVTVLAPGRRDIAMVFQSYALYPHMTVYKNLSFGPSVRRESKAKTKERIEQAAEILGIAHLLQRRPNELSGGQRQRVALGRSMVRDPQLFLLDEPLSNLDAALRVQMRAELVRLHDLLPVTTVYVTHDQVEALTMGDRVAVFNEGELLQIGTPDELYNSPVSLFVAEFIGSPKISTFPGELLDGADGPVKIRCLEREVTIPQRRLSEEASREAQLRVGVRPHDVHLAPEGPSRCTLSVSVEVDAIEHTGAEMFVGGAWGTDGHLMARLHRSSPIDLGDRVEFVLDPADLHIFEASSGVSLLTPSISTKSRRPHEATAEGGIPVAAAPSTVSMTRKGK